MFDGNFENRSMKKVNKEINISLYMFDGTLENRSMKVNKVNKENTLRTDI